MIAIEGKSERVTRVEKLSDVRVDMMQYIVASVLSILGAGLWRLQILGTDEYRVVANQKCICKVPVLALRGRIFDREVRIIVDN